MGPELSPAAVAALLATGLAAGALNVVAGGGSFLTLPMLVFLGLPPTLANGTNRIAIVVQNVGAVWGFHRHRVLDWSFGRTAAVPALAGAALGTWLAVLVSDEAFRKILALLMVLISLWTLFARRTPRPVAKAPRLVVALAFFAVGVYLGFVQAGVGFLILAVTSFAGFDLVKGNAVKVLIILIGSLLSLVLFTLAGLVVWLPGLLLGTGTLLGGQIGVRLTVRKGDRWVRAVVTATVILFAIKLWLDGG